MSDVPSNVNQVIKTLVPSSILNELVCFVFYDNHPVQSKICDITICTKHGEVKEYYKREEVSSLFVDDIEVLEMRILRNSQCELFYLLASKNEVIILSRKDKLRIHKRVNNVDSYDINDSVCTGQPCLKIVLKEDAVPLVFDDNFEKLGEIDGLNMSNVDDSLPILTQLQRKLTQAKYSIQCNEKTWKEFVELRKLTAFAAYKKLHPNLDSMIGKDYNEICEPLKLKSRKPYVTICNKKIVISFDVVNKNKKPLHEISAFLHSNKPSIVYTTKLFQRTHTSPFWKQIHELKPDRETTIILIVNVTELQYNTTSRVEFTGVISYKNDDIDFIMPFEPVVISYSEFMGSQFDVLANEVDEVRILSVLATTEKLPLTLRIINIDLPEVSLSDMFCQYLEMDHVIGVENAVLHKKSPHHILNGVMIIFDNDNTHCTSMAVHVRSDSQVLPLLHYIHEAIPYRIVVTSPSQKITATIDSLKKYNEDIPDKMMLKIDYTSYVSSMLQQTSTILEYLDGCIVKMNEKKDSKVQSQIGKQIDLFAQGLTAFKEFRSNLVVESLKGVTCLKQCEVKPVVDTGSMFMDNE